MKFEPEESKSSIVRRMLQDGYNRDEIEQRTGFSRQLVQYAARTEGRPNGRPPETFCPRCGKPR